MKTFLQRQPFTLFRDLTTFGSFLFYSLILLLTLAFQQYPLFLKLLLGLLLIMLLSILIRVFYFKPRPQKQSHQTLIDRIDASSFPSIHTARIFFLALTFIFFFRNKFTTIFLILLALFTSYSRIYLKKHDWTDLLGGLILALITFWLTTFF